MLELRSVVSIPWYSIAAAGFAGIAAYVGIRSSRRTDAALTRMAAAVEELTAQATRVNYWTVYRHVQHDLLQDQEGERR
jgi:hypothetical protein